MEKILFLADLHGNMTATLALEKEIKKIQPDEILFLGAAEESPISFKILSIPYDNQLAADIADEYPDLPDKEAYKKELITGVYRG